MVKMKRRASELADTPPVSLDVSIVKTEIENAVEESAIDSLPVRGIYFFFSVIQEQ